MEENLSCRGCLATNCELFLVSSAQSIDFYKRLINIEGEINNVMLCEECCYHLKKAFLFSEQCFKVHCILNKAYTAGNIISKDFINLQRTEHITQISKRTMCKPYIITIPVEQKEVIEDVVIEDGKKEVDIKYEPEVDGMSHEPDLGMNHESDLGMNHESDVDSEDDIPLKKFVKKETQKEVENIMENENKMKANTKKRKKLSATVLTLTKDQQLEELTQRKLSINYQNAPYKCTNCFKGYVDDTAYLNHMKKHDPSAGDYKCDICLVRCASERQHRAHLRSHMTRYQCRLCAHVSSMAHQAREHEKWHQGHTYHCKLCGKTFRKPTSLLTHLRTRHASGATCLLCGDSFLGEHGLHMHTRKVHKDDNTEPIGPEIERLCKECNIIFISKTAWQRHVLNSYVHIQARQHSNECEICKLKFRTNTEMKNHLKSHKKVRKIVQNCDIKKLPCSECNQEFVNKSRLHAHVKNVHLGIKYNKNLVCDVCGKHCTSFATLKYHQRTHTGERPYACSSCDKRFSTSHQLTVHDRVHRDVRPHQCTLCERAFRQRPALTRHIRVHSGAKPYACQYCEKKFSQSNSLKIHVRAVHLKIPNVKRKGLKEKNSFVGETVLQTV